MTTTTTPKPGSTLTEQAYALLERWTGFAHPDSSPQRLVQTLAQRAQLLGFETTEDYIQALKDRAPTEEEPQKLINLITNGLTAFWRDKPQLNALRAALNLLHSQRPSGPITIWCAGTSTGEEAYTVAIIAHEESIPVHILGTDINTDFLRRATLGVYDAWSLRRLSNERRRRYLTPLDEHRWKINHRAFTHVHFSPHNLLSPPPHPPGPTGLWDLIICKNVLIYFSDTTTAKVLKNFAQVLSPQGFLIFGSSEQLFPERLPKNAPPLLPIPKAGGFLYRPGLPIHTASATRPDDSPPPPLTGLDEPTSDFDEQNTTQSLLQTATEHLRQGKSDLAIACLEACLSYDPFHHEAHCLMGMTLQAIGAARDALAAFQKTLFLEPDHWLAAYRSATIYQSFEQYDLARRDYHRTLLAMDQPQDPVSTSLSLRSLLPPLHQLRQLYRQNARKLLNSEHKK